MINSMKTEDEEKEPENPEEPAEAKTSEETKDVAKTEEEGPTGSQHGDTSSNEMASID